MSISDGYYWASSSAFFGKVLLPESNPGGFILTILLGITGALLGGFLRHWLLSGEPAGVLLAIVGR